MKELKIWWPITRKVRYFIESILKWHHYVLFKGQVELSEFTALPSVGKLCPVERKYLMSLEGWAEVQPMPFSITAGISQPITSKS